MWGPSIIGFGSVQYKYASGCELDWFKTGFSPRKSNLTIYSTTGYAKHENLLGKLGKHRLDKGCLYINKLADVDKNVLKKLIKKTIESKGCLYINKLADVDKNVLKKLIKKTIESDSKLISG